MPEDPYVEAALQAPPSSDYVPGPKEPEQANHRLPDLFQGPKALLKMNCCMRISQMLRMPHLHANQENDEMEPSEEDEE
ncbi:hypothetical protein Tco_0572445 [Tanacetum coccineum]